MRTLLTAHWVNLLTASYETDKKFLQKFLPAKTELNDWNGKYFMSLVAFMFLKPAILGIPSPLYRSFEEINLRFYVRHRDDNGWTNGVVFIKEIAPSPVIGFTAARLYGENFISLPMNHAFVRGNNGMHTRYSCKVNRQWNVLEASTALEEPGIDTGSIEAFIRDHNTAYSRLAVDKTGKFQIVHRPWKIFPAYSFNTDLDIKAVYGKEFVEFFETKPLTSFLMDGSYTRVSWPVLL